MRAVICLDERDGMMFNGRRLSRDLRQRSDLCSLLRGQRLHMSPYSFSLFVDLDGPEILVSPQYLQLCGEEEWCFAENGEINRCFDRVGKLVVYRWNRKYPADVFFEGDLRGFVLKEQKDFAGSSHDRITRLLFERNV